MFLIGGQFLACVKMFLVRAQSLTTNLGNKTPIKAKFGHSDNWTEDLVLMEPGMKELSHKTFFF